MVFPVVMYGCESWTIMKAEHWRIDTFFCLFIYLFCFTILYWFCHTLTWIHQGCTCVPHPEPPPTSLPIPSLWVVRVHQPQAPCIMHQTWTGDSFHIWYSHVSMPFSHIIPPLPSPTESIRLFNTSVSLLLSRIQGYHYHLSKFHIHVLVNCWCFSFWLTSLCIIGSSFYLIRTDSNVFLVYK